MFLGSLASTLYLFLQAYCIPITLLAVVGVVLLYITGLSEKPFRFIYGDLTKSETKKFLSKLPDLNEIISYGQKHKKVQILPDDLSYINVYI